MKEIRSTFKQTLYLLLSGILIHGCIGDDYVNDTVDPELRITTRVDTIEINTDFQLEQLYLNSVGQEENVTPEWSSSDETVIIVNQSGLMSALGFGKSTIRVELNTDNGIIYDEMEVVVGMSTTVTDDSATGSIKTTSSYKLTGNFSIKENDGGLFIQFDDNYCASSALPGLYVYLSNNKNSISNALEIAAVSVFGGAHSYQVDGVGLMDYSYLLYFCKPFNVKVGDGEF